MGTVFRWLIILIILALIAVLIFDPGLKFSWLPGKEKTETQNSAPTSSFGARSAKLSVNGIVVKKETLENKVSITGEVVPNEYTDLKSEISGKINGIYFKEGHYAKKGQTLFSINVDELMVELEKLEYAQELKKSVENRQRLLLEREAISQEEYDQALNELQTAEVDIDLIKTQIAKAKIRAPFNGIVGLREVSMGSYVTPSNVLAPFYSINPAKIDFAVPGRYANQVKKGSKISFTTDASEKIYSGTVFAKESRLDPNTRTLKIRATSPNPKLDLLPGLFTRVELILETKEGATMVPTESVVPEIDGSKVFILRNGKVASVKVEPGTRTDTKIEINSGLSEGDTVLTTGILQVRPGMEVNVKI